MKSSKTIEITRELIVAGRSGPGGWNKEQLVLLGVPWPPPKGWIDRICGSTIAESAAALFLSLKGKGSKRSRDQSDWRPFAIKKRSTWRCSPISASGDC